MKYTKEGIYEFIHFGNWRTDIPEWQPSREDPKDSIKNLHASWWTILGEGENFIFAQAGTSFYILRRRTE